MPNIEKVPKVNKPAIRLWVDALRSGNYVQATEHLVQRDGTELRYCCLGVACDIFAEEAGLKMTSDEDGELGYLWSTPYGAQRTGSSLPFPLMQFLGVEGTDPMMDSGITLIRMNDDQNATFDEIADAIEQRYLMGGSFA